MSDNDYGFYGSGLDGYVHYKQSFDNISGGDVSTDSSDSFCGEDSFCDFSDEEDVEMDESPDASFSDYDDFDSDMSEFYDGPVATKEDWDEVIANLDSAQRALDELGRSIDERNRLLAMQAKPPVVPQSTRAEESQPKTEETGQSREEAYTIIAVMLVVIMVVALLNTAIS